MLKYVVTLFFLLAGFITNPAVAATMLQNGSFEDLGGQSLNNGSWGVVPNLPGWQANQGIELQTTPTLGLMPNHGKYYVELDAYKNSSMSQDVFLTAGQYILSGWYAPRTGVMPNSNIIDWGVAGVLAETVTGPTATILSMTWTQFSQTFLIDTAGTYSVFVSAGGLSDSVGGLVDNMSLAAVPIPAAGLLLLASLAGLGALARRRRSVPAM